MDLDGDEKTEWRKISFRYIFQGTFIFDLLSVIPLNAFIPVSVHGFI